MLHYLPGQALLAARPNSRDKAVRFSMDQPTPAKQAPVKQEKKSYVRKPKKRAVSTSATIDVNCKCILLEQRPQRTDAHLFLTQVDVSRSVCCAVPFISPAHTLLFFVVQRFLLSAAGDRIRDHRKDPENPDEEKRPEEREDEDAGIELEDAQMQTDDLPRVETHEKQGDIKPRCEPSSYRACTFHPSPISALLFTDSLPACSANVAGQVRV